MFLKCLKYCLIVVYLVLGCWGHNRYADDIDNYDQWQEQVYMYYVLNHMTLWIAQDATVRLRHADKVQKPYQDQIAYHLGSIMAGIQDTFRHMVEVYRKYSNLTTFRKAAYDVDEIMNAYYIIKGDFNQLRMEKDLYYKIVATHGKDKDEKAKKTKEQLMEELKKKMAELEAALGPKTRRSGGSVLKESLNEIQRVNKKKRKPVIQRRLEEELYKRSLRVRHWEKKWRHYAPVVEGVAIEVPGVDPESGTPAPDAI